MLDVVEVVLQLEQGVLLGGAVALPDQAPSTALRTGLPKGDGEKGKLAPSDPRRSTAGR